jgi:hypothetical protein
MNMKEMLVQVATFALGYAVGMMVYNRFMGGAMPSTPTTPTAEETTTTEEGV